MSLETGGLIRHKQCTPRALMGIYQHVSVQSGLYRATGIIV